MLLGHDLLEPTVDTRAWREALSLVSAGYEVTVFCWARRDDSLPAEETRDGVRVRRIFASLDSWLPGRMLAFRSAMRQLAEAAAFEVIRWETPVMDRPGRPAALTRVYRALLETCRAGSLLDLYARAR